MKCENVGIGAIAAAAAVCNSSQYLVCSVSSPSDNLLFLCLCSSCPAVGRDQADQMDGSASSADEKRDLPPFV